MKHTEETKRKLSEMRKGEKNQRLDNHPKIVYNWSMIAIATAGDMAVSLRGQLLYEMKQEGKDG